MAEQKFGVVTVKPLSGAGKDVSAPMGKKISDVLKEAGAYDPTHCSYTLGTDTGMSPIEDVEEEVVRQERTEVYVLPKSASGARE